MNEPDQSGKPFSQQIPTQQTDIEKKIQFTLQAVMTGITYQRRGRDSHQSWGCCIDFFP
jgi:hypothetical protein